MKKLFAPIKEMYPGAIREVHLPVDATAHLSPPQSLNEIDTAFADAIRQGKIAPEVIFQHDASGFRQL